MKEKYLTFVMFVLGCFLTTLMAQTISVKGKVTDDKKTPLPGVSVVVKGSTHGTSTDFDGNYQIQAKAGDVLEFSFVGFTTQTKKVVGGGNSYTVNVQLKEDAQQLSEVVVVGFATQKKENLTGAVTSVDSKALENRPVNNVTQALQGNVSGLNFSVGNGGGQLDSNLSFNIRGTGTIGSGSSGSPLVLIDGMEGDMNTLNPNDIESISVLKDAASASIYGSRAAFGVILVTTKSGKDGRMTMNYNTNYRLASPVGIPNMLDSESFAYYFNEAQKNNGGAPVFEDRIVQNIKAYKAGLLKDATDWNPTKDGNGAWNDYKQSWANVDWFKEFYRTSAPSQEHNFTARGGTEKIKYYVSLGWLDAEGLSRYNTDKMSRYSAQGKISAQILPYLKLDYNSRFSRMDFSRSSYLGGLFFHNIARRWPTLPLKDPNGHYMNGNEIAQLNEGRDKTQSDELTQQLALVFNPIKGWVTNVELNYRTSTSFNNWYYLPIYKYGLHGEPIPISRDGSAPAGHSKISEWAARYNFFNTNIYSSYTKEIKKHTVTALAGFQSELFKSRQFSASRDGLYSKNSLSLNTSGGKNDDVSGDYQHWSTAGFFGRLNYNYDSKYLLEVNARYDGSSRFLRDQRWNLFTSASVGWNIAKESFWEHLGKFGEAVSEFKLRGSYGELGNQNTDSWYPFYQTMNIGANNGNWLLNGDKTNTAYAPGLIASTLTWEKVASWNAGFDLTALKNRFKFTFELFSRKTYNMVGPAPELPPVLGTSPARINNTDMVSNGFEIITSWNDKIGENFSYNIKANLTDSRQKITKYPNKNNSLGNYYEGQYLGEIWGYQTRGIAKSDAEMTEWLKTHDQSALGNNWAAGDIMYEDLNGDGKINGGSNTVNDPGDRKIIGNTTPRYNFGLLVDLKYKNVYFSMFWQGTGKRDLIFNDSPYFRGANQNVWQSAGFKEHLDYFRPEGTDSPFGPNLDAYYPRPTMDGGGKNFVGQTRWVQNAAYVRLKNIQLGYDFPSDIMKTIGIDNLRIYISADNVFTFTKLSKIFDPEANGGSWGQGKLYPLSRVISTGLSLTF